ncbi:hypothetical protein GGH91_000279 [Coemansia sp. RSA 2671]|nr:hypothetical protein GGH91_000279 [Coemansia sp. RSA 2671]
MDVIEQQRPALSTSDDNSNAETSPFEPAATDADDMIDENTSELHAALARAVADALAPLSLESKRRPAPRAQPRGHLCVSCNSAVSEEEFAFHSSRCGGTRPSRRF